MCSALTRNMGFRLPHALPYATVVELEYTTDLKSVANYSLRVRVSSVAPHTPLAQSVRAADL